jgi:hypothetical protein
MRTTIEIDTDLIRELKEQGHREGKSLRKMLNAALRRGLTGPAALRSPRRYKCPALPMGTPPGAFLDLDKALALSGAMEDAEIIRKLELRK